MKAPVPFITLDNITLRLRDHWFLENTSWRINCGEHWAVLGPNGSGKSTLVKAILGEIPVVKGRIIHHFSPDDILRRRSGRIAYVSFEQYRDIIDQEELEEDFREFSGNVNEVTTVKHLLSKNLADFGDRACGLNQCLTRIPDQLDIQPLLDRSVRSLSTGEVSRMLLARALLNEPELLILDEPFDGLDIPSRRFILEMIGRLMEGNLRVILITHRLEEIPPLITHVLFLKDGKVLIKGRKEDIFNRDTLREVYNEEKSRLDHEAFKAFVRSVFPPADADSGEGRTPPEGKRVLIRMRKATVRYGDRIALDRFNWTVNERENWAILGPNGAGKTTVLKLALGDNLQSYANDIEVFGKRMGAGQSIWDIKKHIGVISPDLQARYRKKITAFDVVCSGFFDSFGLYRYCTEEQLEIVERWIRILRIERIAAHRFDLLSYGQRQLVLIARAMVKSPLMLFLDEPCESLDMINRKKLLETTEYIGSETGTNLIYITHYEEEILPCITDILLLDAGKTLGFRKNHHGAFHPGSEEALQCA